MYGRPTSRRLRRWPRPHRRSWVILGEVELAESILSTGPRSAHAALRMLKLFPTASAPALHALRSVLCRSYRQPARRPRSWRYAVRAARAGRPATACVAGLCTSSTPVTPAMHCQRVSGCRRAWPPICNSSWRTPFWTLTSWVRPAREGQCSARGQRIGMLPPAALVRTRVSRRCKEPLMAWAGHLRAEFGSTHRLGTYTQLH